MDAKSQWTQIAWSTLSQARKESTNVTSRSVVCDLPPWCSLLPFYASIAD